ncbi:MAG: response regulator [Armatimonadetes bacterium]|nr:response regulator [Armatimonadota bacterium]
MGHTILIVEDNEMNRELMRDILEARGYVVHEASDSAEARRFLTGNSCDLILLDVQLPGEDGLAVTRNLREDPKTRTIPIIAVTAYAMTGDRERILQAGCDAYVSKPINTRELPKIVETFLQGKEESV